jgi:hypothetical protein
MRIFAVIAFSATLFAARAAAAPMNSDLSDLRAQVNELKNTVQKLSALVEAQQQKIDQLTAPVPAATAAPAVPAAASLPASSGGVLRGLTPYIPDIGVVADVVGSSTQTHKNEDGNDTISLRELELVFGHDIDPYSRFDATISFSDHDSPEVEEAYASFWSLPGDLKGRVGRFRPRIGRAAASHRDILETVDEPLVVQRYFGAEGYWRSGAELSGFTPLSTDTIAQQFAVGVLQGSGAEMFGPDDHIPTFYAHLGNSADFGDSASADLGLSWLTGSSDSDGGYEVNTFGLDSTLSYFVTPIQKLKFQSEWYLQNRSENTFERDSNVRVPGRSNPWGMYALFDYRLSELWATGVRFDYVEPIEELQSSRNADTAAAVYLTFFQSEFARWRFQYEHAWLAEGNDDNRFYLQGTFAIGTHKHQLQ